MDGRMRAWSMKRKCSDPFGDLYEVDYDETYQGEEIKAMSAVAGKLYVVTEKNSWWFIESAYFLNKQ